MATPGMLYVSMQLRPGLSLDQFHEWYNNEHGPTRLRLPAIFSSGCRYRGTDRLEPEYLAVYDIPDMSLLETEEYTQLRSNRSPREAAIIAHVDVKRSFLDLRLEMVSPHFVPTAELPDEAAKRRALVVVELLLSGKVADAERAIMDWFEKEHILMFSKVPGWLRTRVFRTPSKIETWQPSERKLIALHEYTRANDLSSLQHQAFMAASVTNEIHTKYIASMHSRTYELFYIFGRAVRDLHHLARLTPSASFVSEDGLTSRIVDIGPAGSEASIQSYVTRPDGLRILYRLEGNPKPNAPTVVCCNSLLTSLHMWDPFFIVLKQNRPDLRLLRYNARGRHTLPQPPAPATLDTLADDLAFLVHALRLPDLPTLIGVSMGGATVLNTALKHPNIVGRFVACDFNAASGEANTRAWKERIAVAEGVDHEDEARWEGDVGSATAGIRKLARQTVTRWFSPHTLQQKPELVAWMTDMVAANDIAGFRYSCQALWDYNLKSDMPECRIPGLFVAGEEDGKGALVTAMDDFKGFFGENGVELRIVPSAGHLPMVEWPEEFWVAIKDFLNVL